MNVSLIGTGLMGLPMAERLLAAGYPLTVYNRTREKAEPLAKAGARIASTPTEAITASELTLFLVSDAGAVRNLLFGDGTPPDLSRRTILQMSTIGSKESLELKQQVEKAGGDYFEAPVLGSRPQAKEGKLMVMVGGRREQFDRWLEILRCFGPDPRLIGEVGKAATLKLALNQIIAAQVTGFSLSLGLVRRAGIDVELFMGHLRQSALYAPAFDMKLHGMRERDFAHPNFSTQLFLKDVELIRAEARSLGLHTAVLDGIREVGKRAVEKGYGDQDYSAVYQAIDPA